MRIQSSSVYRKTENLMLDAEPLVARLPKGSPMVQEWGKRLTNEYVDALTAVALALRTADAKERLNVIELYNLNMTNIRTIMRNIAEFSSRSQCRCLSEKSYAAYLKEMFLLGKDVQAWIRATQREANLPMN